MSARGSTKVNTLGFSMDFDVSFMSQIGLKNWKI